MPLPPPPQPFFPITSKLLRVVAVLCLEYHKILTTESEIFLSLIMKFLDPDKGLNRQMIRDSFMCAVGCPFYR